MAKREYTKYQQNIISNYYKNLDTIMLTKLSELVSELYLAESKKKRDQLWIRVQKAMEKMEVPYSIIEHIVNNQDIEALWQGGISMKMHKLICRSNRIFRSWLFAISP